ncbi:MAG: hypothetical protein J0M12_05190 [Deltaproteobacteria bacterium]|nr:hypothetical protein [Deltaproteobacteria bacterium]
MTAKKDNRIVVLDILSGSSHLDSPIIERSVLTGLAERKAPELKDPSQAWMVGLPAIVAATGFAILFREHLESPPATAITILLLLSAAVVTWQIARSREDALRQQVRVLQEPLQELRDLQSLIQAYLSNLDKRSRRYFHIVTNSKVTSYFILTQIMQKLQEKIDELNDLLQIPSRENIVIAHHLLQGTLVFSDSFQGAAGNLHVVPLARLKTVALQIFEFLDSELKLIEEDIAKSEELAHDLSVEDQGEPN